MKWTWRNFASDFFPPAAPSTLHQAKLSARHPPWMGQAWRTLLRFCTRRDQNRLGLKGSTMKVKHLAVLSKGQNWPWGPPFKNDDKLFSQKEIQFVANYAKMIHWPINSNNNNKSNPAGPFRIYDLCKPRILEKMHAGSLINCISMLVSEEKVYTEGSLLVSVLPGTFRSCWRYFG